MLSRQDLFAALLTNSKRHDINSTLGKVQWMRQLRPRAFSMPPKGFIQHQEVLPQELLSCIEDILELQSAIFLMKKSSINRIAISNMLADIESRLASESNTGPVAECCRIAALITCFLSFTDTWANALIPCRLSDLLRMHLHDSIENPAWCKRKNLQLWFILVGSSATVLNNGCVENLERKWTDLSIDLQAHSSRSSQDEFNAACVGSALTDFIYCDYLLQQRLIVPAWSSLELVV
jgi:hypothetical protein